MDAVYTHKLCVPDDAVDENGHVNNVAYVQWMQDAAVAHSLVTGGTDAMRDIGASWFVRSHRIEYLRPAFQGEHLAVQTWVATFRRARSLRKYRFEREEDGVIVARGETEWVFVDARTGRPRTIPPTVLDAFEIVEQ